MGDSPAPVRRIPLKIAGVIGFFNAVLYLAVIVGIEDRSAIPQAYIWLAIMVLAGGLAWFANRVTGKERRMAIAATVLFFILASFSSPIFVFVYLTATFFAAYGWMWIKNSDRGAQVES